jgi:hypothetical protein
METRIIVGLIPFVLGLAALLAAVHAFYGWFGGGPRSRKVAAVVLAVLLMLIVVERLISRVLG